MSSVRLFDPASSGPSAPASYSGNFLAGVLFKVTQGGCWLGGYSLWCPTGGDTVARKLALWNITGAAAGTHVSAGDVLSGTLTVNKWNDTLLANPVPLAIGTTYNATTGWSAVNGFPDSDTGGSGLGASDSFGSGGHSAGITSGPLFGFSDQPTNGTAPDPWGNVQGVFSTAGTDPTVNMPFTGSNSGNFYVTPIILTSDPVGYLGPFSLWPNKFDTNSVTVPDASVNYDVATEFWISQPCILNFIRYYSPSGTSQLATSANVWQITQGGLSGNLAAQVNSPSWSGAAGSGWISCTVPGSVILWPGKYKVSVYNNAATPDGWSAKDANTDYWRAGEGKNGIGWGPLFAPQLSRASLAYNYNGNAGGTPPYSDGTTLQGQPTFTNGPPDSYPYLFATVASPTSGSSQNYWVDVGVSTAPIPSMPIRPGRTWQRKYRPIHTPPGVVAAPPSVAHGGSATLAGSGTLIIGSLVTMPAAAILSGLGSLTTGALVTQPGSATLSGSGTLIAGVLVTQPAAAVLSGSGTLTTGALVTQPAATILSGSGTLVAGASAALKQIITASGSGTLIATATVPSSTPRPPQALGGTVLVEASFTDTTLGGTVTGSTFAGTVTNTNALGIGKGGTVTSVNALGVGLGGTVTRTNSVGTGYGGIVTNPNASGVGFSGTVVGWSMIEQDIVLGQYNDETLNLAITSGGGVLNITGLTIEVYFKTNAAALDTDPGTVKLSTTTGEVVITSGSGGLATVSIPSADLQLTTAPTFWRCDIVNAGKRNTVFFGSVKITDL